MRPKADRKDKLNVRHFDRHVEGLDAKHDVTVQKKFQALHALTP